MISRLVLVLACLLSYVAPSELFNNLDEKEISFIAYRLQDEKEQRLLLKNDVDVMMLKLGRIERNMEEIKHCKRKCASFYYILSYDRILSIVSLFVRTSARPSVCRSSLLNIPGVLWTRNVGVALTYLLINSR